MSNPVSGDVWRYPYLWRWQHEAGETEGRKQRPVVFVAVVQDKAGGNHLFVLPITTLPPKDRLALEVPQIEKRRAGLDDLPLWIILDEYNHDLLERSYYFDPAERVGAFSNMFHQNVLKSFLRAARERRSRSVPRT
jgi:hypothetical protein